ncbi:helix-turn-helix transcriptional regulator [Microvirga arabica]|uniref:helix-turn-helix transcriptional regulator n=1 Tax=Microvirga arabica TaxID=1128671 RepID=UPI001939AEAD|nr:helix-turn-helix transcriptional regulator [Microvirga arabica]MBM1169651.1 helix-turn-helix transcriptional regulator [Microvirga arabica]
MSFDERVHRIIMSAYDAAFQKTPWITVASSIAEQLGAYGTTLVLHRTNRNEVLTSAMAGYRDLPFDSILQEYAAHYHARNPQALFERARPNALIYLDGIDPTYNAENYPDFCRWEKDRIGIQYHATGYCRPSKDLTYALAVSGSAGTGPFSSESLDLFRIFMDHLRQAVDMAHRLGTLETQKVQLESILDGLLEANPRAIATLDAKGQPVFVNSAMLALARERDGIVLDATRLRMLNSGDNTRFQHLCASALRLNSGRVAVGGSMAVSRPSGKRGYALTVAPLPYSAQVPTGQGGTVLVSIVDPECRRELPVERLTQVFGLTPAEARVAAALSQGDRLEEIAASGSVSVGTVRSQLKAIFAKTGATTQAVLVGLVTQVLR